MRTPASALVRWAAGRVVVTDAGWGAAPAAACGLLLLAVAHTIGLGWLAKAVALARVGAPRLACPCHLLYAQKFTDQQPHDLNTPCSALPCPAGSESGSDEEEDAESEDGEEEQPPRESLVFPASMAPALLALLGTGAGGSPSGKSKSKGLRVADLPLPGDELKVDLAMALWELGALCTLPRRASPEPEPVAQAQAQAAGPAGEEGPGPSGAGAKKKGKGGRGKGGEAGASPASGGSGKGKGSGGQAAAVGQEAGASPGSGGGKKGRGGKKARAQ